MGSQSALNATAIAVGKKYLITTDHWFYGPDGGQYRAAFGTVKAIHSSEETLGVKTNARSTNWYVEVGCLTIAGCQIHYAVQTDTCSFEPITDYRVTDQGVVEYTVPRSSILDADAIDGVTEVKSSVTRDWISPQDAIRLADRTTLTE